jgi:hypothetical protein
MQINVYLTEYLSYLIVFYRMFSEFLKLPVCESNRILSSGTEESPFFSHAVMSCTGMTLVYLIERCALYTSGSLNYIGYAC